MEELIKEFEEKEGLYAYFESGPGVIEYNSHFVEWMAKQLALLRVSCQREQLKPKKKVCYKSLRICEFNCSGLCKESV